MPPILAFAVTAELLDQPRRSASGRTFIEVSGQAKECLTLLIDPVTSKLEAHHLDALRQMHLAGRFDVELHLLIAALERDDHVYVRFV